MAEIPSLLMEFLNNMWYDFDYFSDFLANGGLVGLVGVPVITYMLVKIWRIEKQNSSKDRM